MTIQPRHADLPVLGQLVRTREQLREHATRFQSAGVTVFDLGGTTGFGIPWDPGTMPPRGSLILVDSALLGVEATEAARRNRAAGVGLVVLGHDGSVSAELCANLDLVSPADDMADT